MYRLLLILALCLPSAAAAETEVDLELILMVDVSRSMSRADLEIQRRGYAEALTSPELYAALRSGPLQRVAMAYVEWAGAGSQRVVVPWRMLESRADLAEFAAALSHAFSPSLRRTSISSALDFAAGSLDTNGFAGLRRVIDISGDGPNNQGRPVTGARDAALAGGVTINGLPLMTEATPDSPWHLPWLDAYYRDCVTGGPGAFVISVRGWDDFADAVRRKLVLEIAAHPLAVPVQYAEPGGTDCLIGEKTWDRHGGWGRDGGGRP